ncbi:MAG: hypothetical protein JWN66_3846 [Sphingomonas bacterium]|jgi:hypothetical protein|nr:hypothetical protein [Sphingomonas bacterium]
MIRAILIVVLAVAVVSCSKIFSDITVQNHGRLPLKQVIMQVGERRYNLNDVAVGDSLHFRRALAGEGAPSLEWTYATDRKRHELCYFTGTMPPIGTIMIYAGRAELKCK